jgi:hypothetical protein
VADHELQTRKLVEGAAQEEPNEVDGSIDVPTPGRSGQTRRDPS